MNKVIIKQYMNNITKEDIYKFGIKQNIIINEHDLNIIYSYIKNDSERIINNHEEVLNEIKDIVADDTYIKLKELYEKYKIYIK